MGSPFQLSPRQPWLGTGRGHSVCVCVCVFIIHFMLAVLSYHWPLWDSPHTGHLKVGDWCQRLRVWNLQFFSQFTEIKKSPAAQYLAKYKKHYVSLTLWWNSSEFRVSGGHGCWMEPFNAPAWLSGCSFVWCRPSTPLSSPFLFLYRPFVSRT